MWDGLFILLGLSIVMASASFLAGALPLSFILSPRQLRLLTALGTGVLVGTSLIVIIPEGVETLYATTASSHPHRLRDLSHSHLQSRSSHLWIRQSGAEAQPLDPLDTTYRTGPDESFEHLDELPQSDFPTDEPSLALHDDDEYDPFPGGDFEQGGDSVDHDPHVWVGISLILGFILMYLIDTLPQSATAMAPPQRFHISLNQFSFNRTPSVSQETAEAATGDTFSSSTNLRPSSTTVGLVIHAAADGIALGASSTTSSNLSFIIFIALMIHKAPAAFGLTSVLLKQGLTKRQARLHLIVFSLAAPAGALLTWLAIHLLGFSTGGVDTEFATGVLLLFSGGTFLYVAMHTMQENGAAQNDHQGSNGYAGVPLDEDPYAVHSGQPKTASAPSVIDTLVTVGGMLLPLLTQWGHVH